MIIKCPNCGEYVIIDEINCGIFRHGMYKDTLEQINQHETREKCESLLRENKIYGCGKPFMIKGDEIKKCEYI